MIREDWNKFVKVFNLDVDVTVRKEVTKSDVILSLLDEGEIAFKTKREQFIMKVNDKWDLELLKNLIWKPIEDFKSEIKGEKE